MTRTLVLGAVAVVLLSGCKSKEQGVREHFAKDFTCPEKRIEVRERTDLKPSNWSKETPPPAEIAADPERLKMWQAKRDEQRGYEDSSDTIFEARGCDHQKLYACHRHNKDPNYIMCSSRDYPANAEKW